MANPRSVRALAVAAAATVSALAALGLSGCGGRARASAEKGPTLVPATVEQCLSGRSEHVATIPLSDVGGTVLGVDFGANDVQIYIDPTPASVAKEREDIEKAQREAGQSGDPVIMHARGNVLLAWAHAPTAEQAGPVRACTGFA